MAIASAADPHCAVSNEADEADVTIVLGESKIPAKHAICPSVQKDAAVLSARPKNSTGAKILRRQRSAPMLHLRRFIKSFPTSREALGS